MTKIYNIEVLVSENSAVIESLYEELITVKMLKKASIKEKTSIFSKTTQKLEQNEEVMYIEDAEKEDWVKVLTYERKFWVY